MRLSVVLGLAACALSGLLQPAAAQEKACVSRPNALGVSRTIEIDTQGGARLGGKQATHDLLADGEVVLTFDDGPNRPLTQPILDALSAHCTKATFFLIGRMAVRDPDMVQEYARRGHTVGSHTWSHANLQKLTPLKARQEIELGLSAVQQAMGRPIAPFFRFPYLRHTGSTLIHVQERHLASFEIDIDSQDFRTHDGAQMAANVMEALARTRKGIILFHDIQGSTVRGLPGLLAQLKANGYRVVHVVPKEPATTIADFDLQAREEFTRLRTVATQAPMRRALILPVAGSAVASKAPVTLPAAAPAQPAAPPAATVPPPAEPAATALPKLRPTIEGNWKADLWR